MIIYDVHVIYRSRTIIRSPILLNTVLAVSARLCEIQHVSEFLLSRNFSSFLKP